MSDKTVKCPRCKCYRTKDDYFKNGRRLKSCINCRNNTKNYRLKHQMCVHNLQKYFCKNCSGSQICIHNIQRCFCKNCSGSQICIHNIQRCFCKLCGGSNICIHKLQRYWCKTCSDPIKISIQGWISSSKKSDKKYNRYDADRFIDKCFLKELVKDYPNCYYCEVELQYVEYNDTLATIERLNNKFGHIKSNCVIACRKCNLSKVGQKKLT